MIYLDNAATTIPHSAVVSVVADTLRDLAGNASSLHAMGRAAAASLAQHRATIAAALDTEPSALTFTSGGTESNHWAIHGALHTMRHRGRHIVSCAAEHDCVLAPLKELAAGGYEVTLLQPNQTGQISPQEFQSALRDDTVLVSMMLVNNEVGTIQPISDFVRLTRAYSPALFHTDAVQAFQKIPFTPDKLGVDFLSLSAHKLHGPKGIGALWVRPGLTIPPLMRGGGQEGGLRSGTESLHNIAGFAKAAELAVANSAERTAHLNKLQSYLRTQLPLALPKAQFLPMGAPHIISLSLPGWKSEVLVRHLDGLGIAVSHASACKRRGRSHVLTAMKLPPQAIDGTIRISLSGDTQMSDLDALIAGLVAAKGLF